MYFLLHMSIGTGDLCGRHIMGLAVEMSFVRVDRLCRLCNVGLFHLSSNLWRPGRWA